MIFEYVSLISDFYWSYIGFLLVIIFGIYFSIKSNFFQFKALKNGPSLVKALAKLPQKKQGVHPLKLYFASVGGTVGLGNIVSITTALSLGGPGSLFWLWVASFIGMLIKYSEIYLGIKYRVKNNLDGYDGGPMYFLQAAFKSKFLPMLAALLLCIYGTEVYQFSVICDTFHNTYNIDKTYIVAIMIILIFYIAFGGVRRLANIATVLMPIFLTTYIVMCFIIIFYNFYKLPSIFVTVLESAFTGHAAVGGFVGSSFWLTARWGISKAVYSGDIGIGYDSIIQAETEIKSASQQAKLAILSLFSDSFICMLSILIVLISGLWQEDINNVLRITYTLGEYFPYTDHFMSLLLFLAGFTTIVGYLTVGYKSAAYIFPKYSKAIYSIFSIPTFIYFAFHNVCVPELIMDVSSGILIFINLLGIIKLRKQIDFK